MTKAIVSGACAHATLRPRSRAPDHVLHADELQRDIGHGREDAGQRDRKLEPPIAVAAEDEVAGGDVAVLVRHRPQAAAWSDRGSG